MASKDYYASSPTVFLPPNNPNHYFANTHPPTHDTNDFNMSGTITDSNANAGSFAANSSLPPTPASLAGRKRSRGDIYAPEEEEYAKATIASPDTIDEMITDSQPVRLVQVAPNERPAFPSRKSQRTDYAAAGVEDNSTVPALPQHPRDAPGEPLIDEATRLLGISWARMDSTEALQINQAAYTKWIQKHYPSLSRVSMWFENSAIPGYLVEATRVTIGERGFYIFSNDLTEAQLVTTKPDQLIAQLQTLSALNLTAPCERLTAETDPITAAQNEVDGVQVAMSEKADDSAMLRGRMQDHVYPRGESVEPYPSRGLCTAHAMELD